MEGYPMGSAPPPGVGGYNPQAGQWGQPQYPQQGQGGAVAYGGYGQWPLGVGRPAPPPSDHYGSYGQQIHQNAYGINAWQTLQFTSQDDLHSLFEAKKSQRYQGIQAEELCQIMNQSPEIRNYYRIHWSLELCKIMTAMLDRSKDGILQYAEFLELLQCLTYWYQTFCQYDHDRSGFIEAHELQRVIHERFGYQLSAQSMESILKRYSKATEDGRLLVAFDDFVSLSVRLRAYTEAFRARDRSVHNCETGRYEFTYDDFLQCVMCL